MTDTPTPETPVELAAKAKHIAMEARDWFARFEFEEARYREGNGHWSLRLEALNHTHRAINELESIATLAASSTAPAELAGWQFKVNLRKPGGPYHSELHVVAPRGLGSLVFWIPGEGAEELMAALHADLDRLAHGITGDPQ